MNLRLEGKENVFNYIKIHIDNYINFELAKSCGFIDENFEKIQKLLKSETICEDIYKYFCFNYNRNFYVLRYGLDEKVIPDNYKVDVIFIDDDMIIRDYLKYHNQIEKLKQYKVEVKNRP